MLHRYSDMNVEIEIDTFSFNERIIAGKECNKYKYCQFDFVIVYRTADLV